MKTAQQVKTPLSIFTKNPIPVPVLLCIETLYDGSAQLELGSPQVRYARKRAGSATATKESLSKKHKVEEGLQVSHSSTPDTIDP